MDQEQAGQHFGVQTPKCLSSCGRIGFGRQRVERRNKIGGKSLARSCLIFNSPVLLYLPTLVRSRAFGSFNLQGTRLLPTAIP